MSSRALWICSLLVIVPVHSFIVHKQLSIVGRRHYYVNDDHSSILGMGGYCVEPESTRPATGQGQHMIFGIRCIEETLVVGPTLQLKNLLPVSEDEGRSSEGSDKASRLLQYLFHDVDLKNKSVVEIGATGVSIAALAWGATSVVVCHPDSDRLKLWEHSLTFFNDMALQGTYQVLTKILPTPVLAPNSILPTADIVLITLVPSQGDDDTLLTSLVLQALRNGSRRVIAVSPDERIIDEQQEIHTNDSS